MEKIQIIFYRTTLLHFFICLIIFLNNFEISLQIQNNDDGFCKSDHRQHEEENLNENQNGETIQQKQENQIIYLVNEIINSSDRNKNSYCDYCYHSHSHPLRPPLLLSSSQTKNFITILNQSKWSFMMYNIKQRYRRLSNKTSTTEITTIQEKSNFEKNLPIQQNSVIQITEVKEQGSHHQNQSQDNLLKLREIILSFSQPFDASVNPESSTECRTHMAMYIKAISNMELWALKMLDSSARLGSGILNGNINQLGDFDQCLTIQEQPSNAYRGQYCLAYIQPQLLSTESSLQLHKKLFQLIQSYEAFKSYIDDPGHRVPRFSLINWGICIPSSCTAKDVEYALHIQLKNLTKRIGGNVHFQVRVESEMCQIKKALVLDNYTIIAISFFAFIVIISLLSTFYDCTVKEQNEWLTVFSFKKNTTTLFNTSSKSTDDISVIHGIRFFNALMLLLAHKSLAIFFVPYTNRTEMSEILGQSWTVIGRAASLYTDPFLLFSGVLASYSIIGKLQRNEKFCIKNEYLARFLRIVPPLAALILFCTFVLPLLSTGPQWNLVIGHHALLCKKYWWRNLLFIHNYFGFANMCLTHTHHLGIDTQLFFITPFMVLSLWKWPKKSFYFVTTLAILATFARFYTTINNELSNYVYFGTTIQRLFKTADYMYSFPPYRSTIYFFGLLLGYILRVYKGEKQLLTKTQLYFGWIISVICCTAAFLGPAKMGDINYKYNQWHAAFYAAFAPIGWCSCFAWIVFVSHKGHKNFIIKLLSWKGFQITTKLSYAIYLTQFPVFFFNVGRRRHLDYFQFIPLILNFNELIWIILCSIVLTLLFDIPFQNIKRILLKKTSRRDDYQYRQKKSIINQKKEAVD